MKDKIHENRTLMNWSKKDLVDRVMCLEHNNAAQAESFEIQYRNCMKMVEDMNLLNDRLKEARMLRSTQTGEGKAQ
ncbi:hypothetical protein OBV_25330 [Oscillibacter valericigenes Sjm18-20]|nr:hypothetical protein OBV_25330 [Oscillibacter valericigenes Sjm18-20]